jgi:hypothetical protein
MKDSTRKSFVFSTEAAEKLEKLTKTCRLDSSSNTIRVALTVLEELITAIQGGGTIIIREATGRERFYHPLLEPNPDVVVQPSWFQSRNQKDNGNLPESAVAQPAA